MDFLTNPNLKNVAELSTTSSKVLVVDGASNTIKWRSPSGIVSDGGVASSVGRVILATAEDGWSVSGDDNNDAGTPIPNNDVRVFVIGFKPTSFRLSFSQGSAGATNLGVRAQFSTSSTDWSSVTNGAVTEASTYGGSGYVVRTGTGSLSLSGSAPYYVRFLLFNDTGASQSLAFRDLTLELWN
jgi:hypothetical protein